MLNGILPQFPDICRNVHGLLPLCKLNPHERHRMIGTCVCVESGTSRLSGFRRAALINIKNKSQHSWFESFVFGDVFYFYPFFFPEN